MSNKYKESSEVPTSVLIERLKELSDAVTKGEQGQREFTMRIPAEVDRDADIVLSESARRLAKFEASSQWVSVEDRLPELNEVVLCKWHPNAIHEITLPYPITVEAFYSDGGRKIAVTHWMPLPPKQQEGE